MSPRIIEKNAKGIKVEIFIPFGKTMLSTEENISRSLNKCGDLATSAALYQYDTDGSPITANREKYTSKGKVSKKYQAPYGEIDIESSLKSVKSRIQFDKQAKTKYGQLW